MRRMYTVSERSWHRLGRSAYASVSDDGLCRLILVLTSGPVLFLYGLSLIGVSYFEKYPLWYHRAALAVSVSQGVFWASLVWAFGILAIAPISLTLCVFVLTLGLGAGLLYALLFYGFLFDSFYKKASNKKKETFQCDDKLVKTVKKAESF